MENNIIKSHCGACGQDYETNHNCIQSKFLSHILEWGYEGLEDTGHDLGHYTRRIMKNLGIISSYALVISEDTNKNRTQLHKSVCQIIGADHKTFKPFESEDILHVPSYEQALSILWLAIVNHMWTYTTTYRNFKIEYRLALSYYHKYFGTKGKYFEMENIYEI